MPTYHPRKISFKETLTIGEWKVKVYTISKSGLFEHALFYEEVKKQLPQWLEEKNSFNNRHDHQAFLILHPASEGIFSIINWWVGENMLNTHTYLTEYDSRSFKKISGDGLFQCVWELEVTNHERIAWTEHVLKPSIPNFEAYTGDTYSGEF